MYLTLTQYLNGAQTILKKQGYGYLCQDEDAIAHVAHFMMVADQKFSGYGLRDSWRMYYAKFGILTYHRTLRHNRKYKHVGGYPLDFLEGNIKTPDDIMETKELIHIIKNHQALSDRQKECLSMYFMENHTLASIGQHFGITRERVRQIINQSLQHLKEFFHVESI